MGEIVDAAQHTFVLIVIAWVVIVGGVGSALAQVRAGRPLFGFVVAVLTPIPILGWIVVIGLTESAKLSSASVDSPLFPSLRLDPPDSGHWS